MDDYREEYRHNIFDMNVPPPTSAPPPGYHPSHFDTFPQKEFFNSTVPSLNPRYDPTGEPNNNPNNNVIFGNSAPSPDAFSTSRSRSHSREEHAGSPWDNRPPSSAGGSAGGPVRTQTRNRRERNSFSSTSPPPGVRYGGRPNPVSISIPRSTSTATVGTPISPIGVPNGGWNGSVNTATTDNFGLPPTPDSIIHGFSSSPSEHHQGFNSYHPHVPLPPLHEGHNSPSNVAGYQHHHPPPSHNPYQAAPPQTAQQHGLSSSLPQLSSLPPLHSHHQYLTHHQQQQQQPSPPLTHSSSGGGGNGGGGGSGAASSSPTGTTGSVAASTGGARSKSSGPSIAKEDKASYIANEKKRRRRESHNAVERRRRDNINEKISELATLIPDCMLDGNPDPALTPNSTTPVLPPSPTTGLTPISPSNGGNGNGSPTSPNPADVLSIEHQGLLNTFGLGSLDPLPENAPASPISPSFQPNGGDPVEIKSENGSGMFGVSSGGSGSNGVGGAAGQVVKANKGVILRKSVDYIRYLQQLVSVQGARNRELEAELRGLRDPNAPSSSAHTATSFGLNAMGLGMSPMSMGPMMSMFPQSSKEDGGGTASAASTITPGNALRTPTSGSGMDGVEGMNGKEGLSPLSEGTGSSVSDDHHGGLVDNMLVDDGLERERGRGRKRS